MRWRAPTQTPLSFTPISTAVLQRQCAACNQRHLGEEKCSECEQKSQILQRRSTSQTEVLTAPPVVHQVLNTSGQALDPATRQFMESRFGQDFSNVRVHTDTQAATSATSVNALAYTVGKNIVFGANQYAPQTARGKQLIAHELTHVMQQSAGSASIDKKAIAISPSNTREEQEAESVAHQVVSNSPNIHTIHPHPVAMQREEAKDQKDDTIQFSSGLRLNKDLLARMLVMCDEGKLDPMQCVEMRKQLQPRPSMFGIGLTPQLNLGEAGKTATPFFSPIDINKPLVPTYGLPTILPPATQQPPASAPASPLPPATQQPPASAPASPANQPSHSGGLNLPDFSKYTNFSVKVFGNKELNFDLPSSVSANLPFKVGDGKQVVINFKAETSKVFSFSIKLLGLPKVEVGASASVNLSGDQPKGKFEVGATATKQVCNADTAESLKAQMEATGKELVGAVDALNTARNNYDGSFTTSKDVLEKAGKVGGKLKEIYDLREKAMGGCKPVPMGSLKFVGQGTKPNQNQPPTKLDLTQPSPLGNSIMLYFEVKF
jgi:hypothetical protein